MYGSSDNNHQIENSINDFTNHKKTYNLIESSYFKKNIQSSQFKKHDVDINLSYTNINIECDDSINDEPLD